MTVDMKQELQCEFDDDEVSVSSSKVSLEELQVEARAKGRFSPIPEGRPRFQQACCTGAS
jgi:hypothetical protein